MCMFLPVQFDSKRNIIVFNILVHIMQVFLDLSHTVRITEIKSRPLNAFG